MARGVRRWGLVLGFFLCAVAGVYGGEGSVPFGFVDEVVAEGFLYNTDICFLPGGPGLRFIALEKDGLVRLVVNGVVQGTSFLDIRSRVNSYLDRGLLSCAVDTDFNGRFRYIYLAHAYRSNGPTAGPQTGQVIRLQVNTAGTRAIPSTLKILLGTVTGPGCARMRLEDDVICCDSQTHCVGGLDFDSNGHLWSSNGDGAIPNVQDDLTMRSQKPESLNGKLLRLDRDGNGVPGNPYFVRGVRKTDNIAKVWAIGERNSWRIHLDPILKVPWIGEVGWASREEFNLGVRNANLEWPCYQGTKKVQQVVGFRECANMFNGRPINGTRQRPLYEYSHAIGAAASAAQRVSFPDWPAEYRNWIFAIDYVGGWMIRMRVNKDGRRVEGPYTFATNLDGPVQTRISPDGTLWYVSITGQQVRRIRWAPDRRPPKVSSVSPPSGATDVEISVVPRVFFTKFLDERTLAANVRLRRVAGNVNVPIRVDFNTASFRVSVRPRSNLAPNTMYEMVIGGVKSPDGQQLAPTTTSRFTTGTGRSVYISDLPFVRSSNAYGPVERDMSNGRPQSRDGRTISLRGEEFEKGLGVNPPSSVVVRMPSGCTSFRATVGCDDASTNHDGCRVLFEVYADGRKVFDSRNRVPRPLTRVSPPLDINADTTGASTVELRAINGGWPERIQNLVSWGDARFRCGNFDSTPPKIASMVPANGAKSVALTASIRITFSEAMEIKSVIAAISVRQGESRIGWTSTFNGRATQITLNTEDFKPASTYVVTVDDSARDIVGNKLSSISTFRFTTIAAKPTTSRVLRLTDVTPLSISGQHIVEKGGVSLQATGTIGASRKVTYKKGVFVRGFGRLSFNVPRNCNRLTAIIGIDGVAQEGKGSVGAQIGGLDWSKKYVNEIVRGFTEPIPINVVITGERVLRFSAVITGDGDDNDYLTFANAKLQCAGGDVFVSDLKPFLRHGYGGSLDFNMIDGKPLSLRFGGGFKVTHYAQGIKGRPNTAWRYRVPPQCATFISDVGIDRKNGDLGTATFSVRPEGKPSCNTGLVRGSDPPRRLTCDVASANSVTLVGGNGGNGRAFDEFIWANPRLICGGQSGPPTCSIDPLPKSFRIGDKIRFSGKGSDSGGKPLAASAFRWRVVLHHCQPLCHTHEEAVIPGVRASSIDIGDHGDYHFFEFEMTVCNGGQCTTCSSNVMPVTAKWTVTSNPRGLEVGVDSTSGPGPVTATVVVGSSLFLTAVAKRGSLEFDRWSHNAGAPATTRLRVTNSTPRQFTAIYKDRNSGGGGGGGGGGAGPVTSQLIRFTNDVPKVFRQYQCARTVPCPVTFATQYDIVVRCALKRNGGKTTSRVFSSVRRKGTRGNVRLNLPVPPYTKPGEHFVWVIELLTVDASGKPNGRRGKYEADVRVAIC